MPTLADRLKELAADKPRGWQAALSRKCGISQPSVADWISGKTKSLEGENLLCATAFFEVHPQWLASGRGPKWVDGTEVKHPATPSVRTADGLELHQFNIGGSMGFGVVLQDQPGVIQSWRVTREWVEKNLPYYTSLENLAIVTGFGDSMVGMFNPGDPLIVDRGITRADVDGVYFFRVDGEGFIKRLQRIPGEGVLVISENPKYRDWTIKKGMDFEVMAKVLRAWNGQNL